MSNYYVPNDPNGKKDGTQPQQEYKYVFFPDRTPDFRKTEPEPPKRDPEEPPKRGGGVRRFLFASVVLIVCVMCSFAFGYLGYRYAAGQTGDAESGNAKTQAENVLTPDPQRIIEKSESDPSEYGSAGEDVFSISQAAAKVKDSVVVIRATVQSTSFSGLTTTGTSSGSGVIISPDGYILTCNHVVEGATAVNVVLNNNVVYQAAVVGTDDASDLAVLKITPEAGNTFPYAVQGCSSDLVVGEWVVAIGNPLGTLSGTTSAGIVSATERSIKISDGSVMTLIQTDTAINSGNSGGGLFNLKGELIGVVNAKYAANGVEGLAFAIPIDSAYEVELDLMQYGYVRGVVDDGLQLTDVTITSGNAYSYRRNYGITESGVYVEQSKYCEDLGFTDRILSIDGEEVMTVAQVEAIIAKHKVGDTLKIRASRLKSGTGTEREIFETELTLREYVPERAQ